LPYVKDILP